jgi:hypothetical protein
VKFERGEFMLPVGAQAAVEGLYSSALDKIPFAFSPPATSTSPLGKSTA